MREAFVEALDVADSRSGSCPEAWPGFLQQARCRRGRAARYTDRLFRNEPTARHYVARAGGRNDRERFSIQASLLSLPRCVRVVDAVVSATHGTQVNRRMAHRATFIATCYHEA